MPVYNSEKYIREAIESILNQTFKDFEFIIIDDGSIDNSLKIIQSYKDPRIFLIKHKTNKGLIYSLNEGVNKAKGNYIARMDADDISIKNRFSKQLNFLKINKDISILGSWVQVFGDKNYIWKTPKSSSMIKARMIFESSIAHPSVMFKKEIFSQNQLSYEKKYINAEDFALWVKAAEKLKLSNFQEVLLKYRINNSKNNSDYINKQNASKFKIRKNQFKKINLNLGGENGKNHQKISDWSKDLELKDLFYIGNWLRKILIKNLKFNYYKQYDLVTVIGERWLGLVHLSSKKNFLTLFFLLIYFDLTIISFIFLYRRCKNNL